MKFCAQLLISSNGNDLSLLGSWPHSSQVYPKIGATLTCENSYAGEFMSTFIYASNDDEVVWIPSKSGIFSIASAWDQIRQKKPTVLLDKKKKKRNIETYC